MPTIGADPLCRQAEEDILISPLKDNQLEGWTTHSCWEPTMLPRYQAAFPGAQTMSSFFSSSQQMLGKCKGTPQVTKHIPDGPLGKFDAEKWTYSKVVVQARWRITEKTAFHGKYPGFKSPTSSLENWKHKHTSWSPRLRSTAVQWKDQCYEARKQETSFLFPSLPDFSWVTLA